MAMTLEERIAARYNANSERQYRSGQLLAWGRCEPEDVTTAHHHLYYVILQMLREADDELQDKRRTKKAARAK